MRKVILAVLLGLTLNANAYQPTDKWTGGDTQVQQATKYWTDNAKKYVYWYDENGQVQAWRKPQKYEDWTYVDENGYDYTIKIIIEE